MRAKDLNCSETQISNYATDVNFLYLCVIVIWVVLDHKT